MFRLMGKKIIANVISIFFHGNFNFNIFLDSKTRPMMNHNLTHFYLFFITVYICFDCSDYNLNPLSKISEGFLLTAGRNSKGRYVCSGVC